MAYIGDSCLRIGNANWYIGDEESYIPNASLYPEVIQASVNSYASVDATGSYSDDDMDNLDYEWSVTVSPDDSDAGKSSLLDISSDGKTARLLLDKVGPYRIKLVVKGATGGCSQPAFTDIIAVPFVASHSSQIALDTSWIWQLLPSFWRTLDRVDRNRIETFWRGALQIVSSDILQAFNIESNKSIATIQKHSLKRWSKLDLAFTPPNPSIVFCRNKLYEVTSAQKSGLLLDSVDLNTTISVDSDVSQTFGAIGISDREVILPFILPKSDIGSPIVVTVNKLGSTEVLRTSIISSYENGLYSVIGLANSINISSKEYNGRFDCRVDISPKPERLSAVIKYQNVDYASKVEYDTSTRVKVLNKVQAISSEPISIETQPFIQIDDAEKLGVSSGDIVVVKISDILNNISSDVYLIVSGVSDNHVLVKMRDKFEVVLQDLLNRFESQISDANLFSAYYSYLTSEQFVRRLFYRNIQISDQILVELSTSYKRAYTLSVSKIIRTKRVPIDSNTVSIPKLTEFIERVQFVNNEVITQDGQKLLLTRDPIDLNENLSYYVQQNVITGGGLRRSKINKNVVYTAKFNFKNVSIQTGDYITIDKLSVDDTFMIVGVYELSLLLDREINTDFYSSSFTIRRDIKRSSKFLVFTPQLDLKTSYIDSLWSEVRVLDNAEAIDLNFGSIIGMSYDTWTDLGIRADYYDTVIGLLLARITAPSIKNMELVSSIISGIPYSDRRAKIRDINTSYEVDLITGLPKTTMMLLEEVDDQENPTGFFKSYKFPSKTAITEDNTSGIAINPATGSSYKINDVVERFSVIALGAYVSDLYRDALENKFRDVRDRHRFKITINVDSAESNAQSYEFIHKFILEIKPTYTYYMMSLLKFLVDEISIEDDVFIKLKTVFRDNPYKIRNIAQVYNFIKSRYQRYDNADFIELLSNYPKDGQSVSNGSFSTISSSTNFSVLPFGFKMNKNKDLLVIRTGKYAGRVYPIHSIESSTSIKINAKIDDINFAFNIVRPITYELFSGLVQSEDLLLSSVDSEVVEGDLVMIDQIGYSPLEIVSVDNGLVRTIPPITTSINSNVRIIRPRLDTKIVYEGDISAQDQLEYKIPFVTNCYTYGLQPGDLVSGATGSAFVTAVTTSDTLWLSSPINDSSVKITRELEFNSEYNDVVDEFQKAYIDTAYIVIKNVGNIIIDGIISLDSTVASFIKLGDIVKLQVQSGFDDVGEGHGVYRIIQVLDNNRFKLSYSGTYDASFDIIRQTPLRRLFITDEGLTSSKFGTITIN